MINNKMKLDTSLTNEKVLRLQMRRIRKTLLVVVFCIGAL